MAREIGAVLTLRDNMSAVYRGVRREQSSFRTDVAATRRALNQQMEVRVNATAATRAIARVRTAIEPLRSRIVTAVAVRDNATRDIRRIRNEGNALGRQAIAPFINARDSASRIIDNIGSKLSALRAAAAVPMVIGAAAIAGGAVAIKSGANLEQQQIAMKHFIGVNNKDKSDTEIIGMRDSYMKDLRENANATPFKTTDVVGAGARAVGVMGGDLKGAMGLVTLSEDMAALNPGKTISDAMEALADAKNGEFERMKEFGFKVSAEEFKGYAGKGKNDDMSESDTLIAYQALVNKKLNPYFKGGAEALANSGTGLASTVVGKTGTMIQDTGIKMLEHLKPTLRSVIGMIDKYTPQMNEFGVKIADGIGVAVSKLPTLKQYLKDAFETARPTITWVSDVGIPKARDILGEVLDTSKSVYNFFKDNWELIVPIVGGVTIAFGTYKAVTLAVAAASWVAQAAQLALGAATVALNLVMSANPFALAIIGVALLAAGGIALYRNFDVVKEKVGGAMIAIENGLKTMVNGAIGYINDFIGLIRKIPGFGDTPLIAELQLTARAPTRESFNALKGEGYYDGSTSEGMRGVRGVDGILARGLDYVPFDGYIAKLHKGERVQKASENPYNGRGNTSSTINKSSGLVVNMYGTTIREEADIRKIAEKLEYQIGIVAMNM